MYTKAFLLSSLANFLVFGILNAYNLLPLYIQSLGGREGEIGRIMAGYHVAAILAQASAARALDRWPRRPVLRVSSGALVLVTVGFALSTRLGWHFYLLRFLHGAALALFGTAVLTLIADQAPPGRRAEALGLFGVSGLASIAIAPAVGEQILRAAGFPAFFWAVVLAAVVAFAVCWAIPASRLKPASPSSRVDAHLWLALVPILLPGFQFGLANTILFVFLPPFGRLIDLPRVAPFYVAFTAAAILVRVGAGRLADRLGPRRIILPALAGQMLGLALCSGLHATWLLILVGVLNGAAQGFVFPAASAMAFEAAPGGRRAQALALFNIAVLLGGMLGSSAFGWVAESLGYRPGFGAASLVLAVGAVGFWRATRATEPRAPGQEAG
ncbi:MAG: MFS transporter [Candidatus Methylomirabilales bacterium]